MATNWSSFVPDLIVGLATGSVVGLILYFFQVRAAQVRSRADARAVSLRIVQPLLLALQRPEYLRQYVSVTPIPRKLLRAIEIVEQSNLDYWHALEPTDLTTQLLHFRDVVWDLREDADDLDQVIRHWVELRAADRRVVEYATAELLDAPDNYLLDTFPDAAARAALAELSMQLRTDKLVIVHKGRYRQAIRRTERATKTLHEVLVEKIRADRQARKPEDTAQPRWAAPVWW